MILVTSSMLIGTIDPEGWVLGSPGNIYWNSTSKSQFVKETGVETTTGWREQFSAGTGGSVE